MTFNDLQSLMAENIENFSDGKKPTFGNWLMFAQAYSAALAPPLDRDYANSCLSAAGIKKGAIISAEVLDALFTNLYSQSYHINTIHDFLSTNEFANGDKPTGAQFSQLNSHAFLHASRTQIRVVIDSKRISGYNTNSSAGIDFKTYEDSYVICNPSQQGGHLSTYANVFSTAYINMPNTVPIILSPYIGIQLFGCTFTNANIKNIIVVDDNLDTEIGSMQTILQSNTTVAGISTAIMMLSQSTLNRLTILLA